MSNNTDHHIKYVTRLAEDIRDEGENSERSEQRFNKLIYCLNKLTYNITSGRTTVEYVNGELTPRLQGLELDEYTGNVLRLANDEVARRNGVTLIGLLDNTQLLNAE